ncbi:helix-turn-helix domain-containing protein [Clostridium folliculivorans]|uniref:helix-turn-helix domain-containing protein n=1 Tax=Clostridium folliculivorans TaxID=2886038 RepID=UPI0021C265E0|nr:helix-turn-helix transcriptional regulator [Clostridium folliculivorans]GKU32073.1 transcriptional regulator [Clostridium folliculivorans]
MFGKNIKAIREAKKIGVNELSRLSGVNASYISALERDEKKNPSVNTLEKLAAALEVSIDEIMKLNSTQSAELSDSEDRNLNVKDNSSLNDTGEFKTAEEAMKFILKQPAIMGYGGFDIKKLSDDEMVQFANELLNQLQLLGLKYKK